MQNKSSNTRRSNLFLEMHWNININSIEQTILYISRFKIHQYDDYKGVIF